MRQLLNKIIPVTFVLCLLVATLVLPVSATECSVLDGKVTFCDDKNAISSSSNSVTITAKAGAGYATVTNTVTMTNTSGKNSNISFKWSASGADGCTVNGTTADSGDFSENIAAGSSITITLKSIGGLWWAETGTLTISDITCEEVASTYPVTVNIIGSGTVKLNDTPITSGAANSVSPTDGATLTAAASSGYSFVGWTDSSYKLLSKSTSYSVKPTAAMSIQAVFAKNDSEAWFYVDETYLINGLTAACSNGTKIVLAHNGTLVAGNYTIPAGVTLLIPFDSVNTLYTTTPATEEAYTAPTAYRTLTMANGANITVNGAISVSGKHSSKMNTYNGQPHGPQGFIVMNEGSNIAVENSGVLYAWGYIVGEKRTTNDETPKGGTVTINSGGTVYECFQITDYRGGSATSGMTSGDNINTYRVFPMSQYYVQNVQVPMTLHAGATENGYFSVAVSMAGNKSAPVPFIGSSGMFRIDTGYIVKDYDEKNDRLLIDIHGDIKMAPMTISIDAGFFGAEVTINSSNYVLPLSNSLTVTLHSGYTLGITQDLAVLPGAVLEIEDGASVTIGTSEASNSIYIYDLDQWGGYVGENNGNNNNIIRPLSYAYDRFQKRTVDSLTDAVIIVNGTVDASNGYAYTTSGGANICSTGKGKVISGTPGASTVTYQATQVSTDMTYVSIPITPAVLQNDIDSIELTEDVDPTEFAFAKTAGVTGTVTYTYSDGMWRRESKFHGISVSVNDALDLNFYIAKSQLIQNYPYKAVITKYFATGYTPGNGTITPTDYTIGQDTKGKDCSEITIPLDKWTYLENEGLYKFSFSDISAKEMCDDIVVTIQYPDDAKVISRTTSVRDYAKAVLEISKDDTTITNAMVDMLNYGAAAQTYYNYGEKDSNSALILANAGLTATSTTTMPSITDSDTKCVMADGTTIMNHNKWGSRLMLINRFGMHFTFDEISTDDGEMSATMKIEGDDTVYPPLSYQKAKSNDREGLRYFSTENAVKLSIKDADKALTVTVTDRSGNTVCTITDSVASYIARMLAGEAKYTVDGVTYQYLNDAQFANLTNLLNALMKFSASATDVTADVIVDIPEEVSTNG